MAHDILCTFIMVYIWEYRDPWDEAKVYVRNLPYDVSSERLVQLFGQDVVVEVTVSICGIGDRRCITRLGIFLRTSSNGVFMHN
ncbi:hypothetical protein TRIUR3_33601 [Triticum urartu]|uniref:RRM domain-containing protein n=1 Tax=Triticum urartu TaxID=4572 RepID=M7YU82_TRIUA|nr:hypothetical protein TRIUR3_33601 [Triticum urartu]